MSEVNTLAEAAGFEVRDVENLREHYALTLRHWVNRLEAHQAEAIRAADEVTDRTCRRPPTALRLATSTAIKHSWRR